MEIYRISIISNLVNYSVWHYCEGYPTETALKSFLLSSALKLSLRDLPLDYSITSLNFIKTDGYTFNYMGKEISMGNRISLECIYETFSGFLYDSQQSTFRIDSIKQIDENIKDITITSGVLEKYLSDKNPLIRELVKKEIEEIE